MTNWNDQKQQAKLKHVASRHPAHFGLTDKVNKADLQRLETQLETIVNTGEQIIGLYRKEEVLHYVDTNHLWLCTTPAGQLLAAFKLADDQYLELTTKGLVR